MTWYIFIFGISDRKWLIVEFRLLLEFLDTATDINSTETLGMLISISTVSIDSSSLHLLFT